MMASGPPRWTGFLDILQIDDKEFYSYLEPLQVHPWKFDPSQVEGGPIMPDFDKWDRTDLSRFPVGPKV